MQTAALRVLITPAYKTGLKDKTANPIPLGASYHTLIVLDTLSHDRGNVDHPENEADV
jgi:hypothetical protein